MATVHFKGAWEGGTLIKFEISIIENGRQEPNFKGAYSAKTSEWNIRTLVSHEKTICSGDCRSREKNIRSIFPDFKM